MTEFSQTRSNRPTEVDIELDLVGSNAASGRRTPEHKRGYLILAPLFTAIPFLSDLAPRSSWASGSMLGLALWRTPRV